MVDTLSDWAYDVVTDAMVFLIVDMKSISFYLKSSLDC